MKKEGKGSRKEYSSLVEPDEHCANWNKPDIVSLDE